ncbi:hypothetical protein EDB83DRAFT_2527858 [Lactarius deliciosus]|nr:hypothetical protein EDB83DRAFT_2527858 [Lactarius deliciosus]
MTPRTSINARAIPVAPQPSIEEIPNPIRRPQPLLQHTHQSSGATDSGNEVANTAGPLARSTDAIEIDNHTGDDDDNNAWSDEPEVEVEDDISELKRLSKHWDAPVYIFFKPTPTVEYINNHKAHVFDSTSNLRQHAKFCWGEEALAAADGARNVKTAHEVLRNHKGMNSWITAAFK